MPIEPVRSKRAGNIIRSNESKDHTEIAASAVAKFQCFLETFPVMGLITTTVVAPNALLAATPMEVRAESGKVS